MGVVGMVVVAVGKLKAVVVILCGLEGEEGEGEGD